MKYFSLAQIQEALRKLSPHHSIFSSTFFVLKKSQVPVGKKVRFSLDASNHDFLREKYRVHPKSDYLLRVFRQRGPRDKDWLDPNYASKGLQSVNTRTCKDVFLHDRNDITWGFSINYIQELEKHLPKNEKISLFHIAVWFYKFKPWEDTTLRKDIIEYFITDFNITDDEIRKLFDKDLISDLSEKDAFQSLKVKWQHIVEPFTIPSDVPPVIDVNYFFPSTTIKIPEFYHGC